MVSWIASSMHTAVWNAGVEYDILMCGCRSQVDCFEIKGHSEGLHDVMMRLSGIYKRVCCPSGLE